MGCWLLLTPNGSRRTYFIAKKIQLTLETETSLNKLASIILDFSRFVLRKLNFKVFFYFDRSDYQIKITKSEFPRFGSWETRKRLWPGFVMPALQPEQQRHDSLDGLEADLGLTGSVDCRTILVNSWSKICKPRELYEWKISSLYCDQNGRTFLQLDCL